MHAQALKVSTHIFVFTSQELMLVVYEINIMDQNKVTCFTGQLKSLYVNPLLIRFKSLLIRVLNFWTLSCLFGNNALETGLLSPSSCRLSTLLPEDRHRSCL